MIENIKFNGVHFVSSTDSEDKIIPLSEVFNTIEALSKENKILKNQNKLRQDLANPDERDLTDEEAAAFARGCEIPDYEGWFGQVITFNKNGCGCQYCNPYWGGMFLCGKCGNKRCPRAISHLYVCDQSNLPNQIPRLPWEE